MKRPGQRHQCGGVLLAGIAACLLAVAAQPVHAGDTMADLISRKLKELDLLQASGGNSAAGNGGADAGARQQQSGPTVLINNRPPAQVLDSRTGRTRPPAPARAAIAPLPRPRPAMLARQANGVKRAAGAGTGAGTVFPAPGNSPAPMRTAVLTDAAGRVVVDPKLLLQERDHTRAVYLKPREIGQWDAATARRVRRNCDIVLAALNVDARPLPSIGGPEGCGIAAPVEVRALGAARVKPAARLNCRMTAALYEWMRNVVQPAARRRFGQPVVAIRQLSDYSCRRRGGIRKGPVRISEHSFGNAIDIGYFELADGRRIHLLKDWGEFSALFNRKAAFLAEVREGACKYFSTVLSPKYNKAHANHFHFDLGRGGRYKICK